MTTPKTPVYHKEIRVDNKFHSDYVALMYPVIKYNSFKVSKNKLHRYIAYNNNSNM